MAKTTQTVQAKTKFYKDKNGDWRWQIKKGRHVIGASSEGYKNRLDCRENYFEIYIATGSVINKVITGMPTIINELRAAFAISK